MTKRTPETEIALIWQNFWNTEHGRLALQALFSEFNMFFEVETNDPYALARASGQRQVLKRLAEMLRLEPQSFPDVARDADDRLSRHIRDLIGDDAGNDLMKKYMT